MFRWTHCQADSLRLLIVFYRVPRQLSFLFEERPSLRSGFRLHCHQREIHREGRGGGDERYRSTPLCHTQFLPPSRCSSIRETNNSSKKKKKRSVPFLSVLVKSPPRHVTCGGRYNLKSPIDRESDGHVAILRLQFVLQVPSPHRRTEHRLR